MLERSGPVHSRGDAGWALACRQRPAAAVLDVNTPGLSGYELCTKLRHEFGDDIAIVMISGVRTEPYDRWLGCSSAPTTTSSSRSTRTS
jgi:DNA-binding response OmpR family regulator